MTARLIDAAEAERIGLVNRVVAPEELEGATEALVDELLANSHVAVGRAKRVIDASARPALAQTLEMEVAVQEYCVAAARESDARGRGRAALGSPSGRARRRGPRPAALRMPGARLQARRSRKRGGASVLGCQSTGPATSVWLPSGRPRISCTRRAQASSASQVDAGLDAHLVQHRDEVLGGDVAGRARRHRAAAELAEARLEAVDPGLERRQHVREPLAARVVEVRGQLAPRRRARRGPARRTRAPAAGWPCPVVSPKPISWAPASRRRAAISSTRAGGTWPS